MTERRDFLKGAAAAAFTTSIFTGNVRGANDRLAGAFIGVGVMGSENLGVAARQPGVEVRAVCDVYQPHLERAAATARRAGHQPREVRDFREILADKSIDFVCISTPDHWHPYMSVEACKAGKDVYVEKTAGVAIGEGLKMEQAAR
jgi:predicted dehydrogenase